MLKMQKIEWINAKFVGVILMSSLPLVIAKVSFISVFVIILFLRANGKAQFSHLIPGLYKS